MRGIKYHFSIHVITLVGLHLVTRRVLSSSVKVMSWNVNGLRSYLKHDQGGHTLLKLIERRNVDILCLQETKLQESNVKEMEISLKSILGQDKKFFWSCSTARKGYSGTMTVILNDCLTVDDSHYGVNDTSGIGLAEGRVVTVDCEKFSLINCYVPNAGATLDRLHFRVNDWDLAFRDYILSVRERRPGCKIIVTGDFNVAYDALDYYNHDDPRTKKQAGLTPEEQASFRTNLLQSVGLIDTFRSSFPSERLYSFFSAIKGEKGRFARQGLRLDFVLTDAPYKPLSAPYIEEQLNHPYSDHCPVGAEISLI